MGSRVGRGRCVCTKEVREVRAVEVGMRMSKMRVWGVEQKVGENPLEPKACLYSLLFGGRTHKFCL